MGRSSRRKRARREGTGNCYDSAVETVIDLWLGLRKYPAAQATIFLCHGTVTGQGPIAGLRMGHAWAEYGDLCLDNSNGSRVTMTRDRYYALAEASNVQRYRPQEMFINLNKHGHYGPWHE